MMKAKEHSQFNAEFPENFTWEWVDSQKLSSIACLIKHYILTDLKQDRNYVPGLRAALIIISEEAELY